MDKEDLLLIFLVVFLLTAILVTIFFGGNQSRHGYGLNIPMATDGMLIPLCSSLLQAEEEARQATTGRRHPDWYYAGNYPDVDNYHHFIYK